MIEVILLKYGVTFKRVFSEPDIFKQFVLDLLDISLNIDVVKTEYEYPQPVGYVRIKYNLFAEDEQHRTIVEIQQVKRYDFFERFLYYHIIGLIEQARNYQGYRFGNAVYTIVVLTSVPDDKSVEFSHAVQDLSFLTEFGNRFLPYPHRLIVVVPRNVNAQTPAGIKPWLELIKDTLDSQLEESDYDSDIFRRIIAAITQNNITPDELAYIKEQESQSITDATERQQAIEAGRREIVQRMKEKGYEISQIMEITGLGEVEVESLFN